MQHRSKAHTRGAAVRVAGMYVGVVAALLMAWVAVSWGGTFVAFGPESFVRSTGQPSPVTRNFSVLNPRTTYTLHINNGGLQGEFARVSSAVITLNGVQIAGPNDFNQTVTMIDKPVTLLSTNTLALELRSQPGSGIGLQILGADNDLPSVVITSPADGTLLNVLAVPVTGTVSDLTSGITRVTCNGLTASVAGATFHCDLTLSEGSNAIVVQATDQAGNVGTAQIGVTVEFNRPPVARAGHDVHGLTAAPVFLDGSASSDPDGDLLTFHWSLDAAPTGSTATVTDPSRPNPQFIPDLPGQYVFALVVHDGKLDSPPARVTLTATTGNAPPNARAGKAQYARVEATVLFDGSGSSDPELTSLQFLWSFDTVPPGSTLTDTQIVRRDSATPTFIPDIEGTYVLRLRVSDGVLSDVDTVEVFASRPNVGPNAAAGLDVAVQGGKLVTLDGTGSFDADMNPAPLTFAWIFVALPATSTLTNAALHNATTATPSFTPDVEGAYLLRLTVSDGGQRDADNMLVFVDTTLPTLQFVSPTDGATVGTTTPTFTTYFSDSGSGLDVSSYRTLVNGVGVTASTTVTPTGATYTTAAPLPAGDNQATAQIADRAGNVRSVSIHFTVAVFRAIADCAPTSGTAPLPVTFRSRGEFTGGTIVRYRWDFQGDGVFDTSDAVATDRTFTFNQAGTFMPVLEVTNNLGKTATDKCTIQVSRTPPTATANATPSNGAVPLLANFTCTGSVPNGTIVRYEWDFEGDGLYDYSSPTTGSTSHTYTTEGTFVAVCRVTDNLGFTGTARTTTTVIRSGPPGSPSVTATASPGTGNAPLNVSFNGSVTSGGPITRWEWDFDGDSVFDFVSTTSPATTFQYTKGGVFAAALRATNSAGLSSIDTVEVVVNLTATLSIANNTFDPTVGQTAAINTSISAGVPVRLLLKDRNGAVIRTLVNTFRAAGSYSDAWNGKDDAGRLLPEGEYFAILEYDFAGTVRSVDLTNSTGGARYNPSRNSLPSTFQPFNNNLLTINFTIPTNQGASEIQAFIGLFNTDTRFVTLLDRVPLGAGTHTIKWDGLDANGKFAVPPPGDQFLFGIFGFTLSKNGIFLQAAPVLSNITVTPNFFDPSTPNFLTPARPTATLTYTLDKLADVELTVTNLTTGRVLRRLIVPNVPGGTGRTITWDGRADNGLFVDRGKYRLALQASDSTGSPSLTQFALVRVFY